jgi:hypothetical protein
MMNDDRVSVLFKFPLSLRRAVVAAAKADGATLNDTLVGLLADYYKVDFEPSGRRGSSVSTKARHVLARMPDELKMAIQLDALERRANMTFVVGEILARRFGIEFRQARPTRTTPFGGGAGRKRRVARGRR